MSAIQEMLLGVITGLAGGWGSTATVDLDPVLDRVADIIGESDAIHALDTLYAMGRIGSVPGDRIFAIDTDGGKE